MFLTFLGSDSTPTDKVNDITDGNKDTNVSAESAVLLESVAGSDSKEPTPFFFPKKSAGIPGLDLINPNQAGLPKSIPQPEPQRESNIPDNIKAVLSDLSEDEESDSKATGAGDAAPNCESDIKDKTPVEEVVPDQTEQFQGTVNETSREVVEVSEPKKVSGILDLPLPDVDTDNSNMTPLTGADTPAADTPASRVEGSSPLGNLVGASGNATDTSVVPSPVVDSDSAKEPSHDALHAVTSPPVKEAAAEETAMETASLQVPETEVAIVPEKMSSSEFHNEVVEEEEEEDVVETTVSFM